MQKLVRLKASQLDIEPALVAGSEDNGPVFFLWAEAPVVGGQCGACHTILWCDPRTDPVLTESMPANVPDSGPGYTEYYLQRIQRFLRSLPACPVCQATSFDRFVNNVEHPRFANGMPFIGGPTTKLVNLDPQAIDAWLWVRPNNSFKPKPLRGSA